MQVGEFTKKWQARAHATRAIAPRPSSSHRRRDHCRRSVRKTRNSWLRLSLSRWHLASRAPTPPLVIGAPGRPRPLSSTAPWAGLQEGDDTGGDQQKGADASGGGGVDVGRRRRGQALGTRGNDRAGLCGLGGGDGAVSTSPGGGVAGAAGADGGVLVLGLGDDGDARRGGLRGGGGSRRGRGGRGGGRRSRRGGRLGGGTSLLETAGDGVGGGARGEVHGLGAAPGALGVVVGAVVAFGTRVYSLRQHMVKSGGARAREGTYCQSRPCSTNRRRRG